MFLGSTRPSFISYFESLLLLVLATQLFSGNYCPPVSLPSPSPFSQKERNAKQQRRFHPSFLRLFSATSLHSPSSKASALKNPPLLLLVRMTGNNRGLVSRRHACLKGGERREGEGKKVTYGNVTSLT